VLATVAAVLHLGNISFAQSVADEAELDGDLSWTSLGHVSELLQVHNDSHRPAWSVFIVLPVLESGGHIRHAAPCHAELHVARRLYLPKRLAWCAATPIM